MKGKALKLAKESLKIESKAISDIAGYLDIEKFSKAVKMLSTCQTSKL